MTFSIAPTRKNVLDIIHIHNGPFKKGNRLGERKSSLPPVVSPTAAAVETLDQVPFAERHPPRRLSLLKHQALAWVGRYRIKGSD